MVSISLVLWKTLLYGNLIWLLCTCKYCAMYLYTCAFSSLCVHVHFIMDPSALCSTIHVLSHMLDSIAVVLWSWTLMASGVCFPAHSLKALRYARLSSLRTLHCVSRPVHTCCACTCTVYVGVCCMCLHMYVRVMHAACVCVRTCTCTVCTCICARTHVWA